MTEELTEVEEAVEVLTPTYYEVKVKAILESYDQLNEGRLYEGNYDAVDELLDLEMALKLADLTEKQRSVIDLIYVQGYTQEEVADSWEIRQQSISKHLTKSIRKIADVYKKWGEPK